jgi:hypothetical protein
MSWKVLVIWKNGRSEFVTDQNDNDSIFMSRSAAEQMADSFRMGFGRYEVQSVNVVRVNRHKKSQGSAKRRVLS